MNLSDFLGVPAVVDNLYTQSATDMLSANQGYEIGLAITDLPNTFSRYDASQSLSDTQKAQILTNIGAKKSFNVVTETEATTAKSVALTDFKDDVDYYDVAYIRMTSSSANTVTIGTGLSSLPNGALINVRMAGTGVTTLVASGTTLNGNLVFAATNDTKSLIKVGTNEYDVIGAA